MLLSIFANDVLPIFIVAAIGYVIARVFTSDVRTLSRVCFNALSPCLVFSLLVTSSLGADDLGRMFVFTVGTILGAGTIGFLIAKGFGLDRATTAGLLLVVMFSNTGNYGLPVVMFAFGKDALAHASVYFAANAITTYSLGVFLASAGRRSVPRALAGVLKVPAVWGVVAASIFMATGTTVPLPIMRPVELLGSAALPVMILVLGMQLERMSRPERPLLVAAAVLMSLVVTPAISWPIAKAVGLVGAARQAAIIQSGMPSAVLTTILALEFDVAPSFVTACVTVSTLVSPITVTLLIAAMR